MVFSEAFNQKVFCFFNAFIIIVREMFASCSVVCNFEFFG